MQSYNLLNEEEKSVELSLLPAFAIGRTVGILLLLQLAAALTLPFILSKPITFGSPAFLTAVTEHSFQIRSAVLLSFVGSALTVYLGITAFQVLRLYSKSVALLFLVVCAVSCTLDVVQAGTIVSMLSISNEFVTLSGATDSHLYQMVGAAVASTRRSAHYTQLLAIGAWLFVFYISLFRFKLVPRVLAFFGIVGVALQFVGVTLMMFLGYRSIGEMAMPLLPIQITVAVWLIIKGFKQPIPAAKTNNVKF
jgi:Domain of unknown function (DUF4386)